MMVEIRLAKSEQDLKGILKLQKLNLKQSITIQEADKEGFVTVDHDFETLAKMQLLEPQVVAVNDGVVVGYALVMAKALRDSIPVLRSLFTTLDELTYKGQEISEADYYVMGQVCIDKAYRGSGLFSRLYKKHKEVFSSKYQYCITEVSDKNKRSIRAHEKAGFENLYTFTDEKDTWHIIILNLNA